MAKKKKRPVKIRDTRGLKKVSAKEHARRQKKKKPKSNKPEDTIKPRQENDTSYEPPNDIDEDKAFSGYTWPSEVGIVDPECVNSDEIHDWESCYENFIVHEIDTVRDQLTPSQLTMIVRILRYRWLMLEWQRCQRATTFNKYDVYNGMWASCGYQAEPMPESAFMLALLRFGDPHRRWQCKSVLTLIPPNE